MTLSARRSRGAGSRYTSEDATPSSRTMRSRTWSSISVSTSRRTGGPKRRRESSRLQRREEVLVVVLLDLEVLVAGDPEGEVLADLHPREELVQVRGDDVLERDEPGVVHVGQRRLVRAGLDAQEARQHRRHLDPREVLLAGLGVDEDDGEVEGEPGDVRERVRGVHGERGEDGEEPVGEDVAEALALLVGELVPPDDGDAVVLERRADLLGVDPGVHRHQLVAHRGDLLQDLARLQPGGRAHRDAGGDAALEAGHPDHEELVEVLREDREEAGALQQRDVLVGGQLQHALVELQPGDLAVQEALGGEPGLLVLRLVRGPDEPAVGAARLLGARLAGGGAGDRDLADDRALGRRLGGGVPGAGVLLVDARRRLSRHATHPVRSGARPSPWSSGVHPAGRRALTGGRRGRPVRCRRPPSTTRRWCSPGCGSRWSRPASTRRRRRC